ncbi:TetR/AcrR family transcriptional regulator [Xylanimonas protaetiae]|uniref:TetR/AcrR family transcriptional regulator n=1 Tax=Xylanimonas protaetiae TaxID=2509457 RepID=A0A4P6F8H2_9MICO|nr:TetR/AcrR family transcriptional regulator [Xylanimonas protaetiae]QAY71845.1 TetR/AcrR family transcriptional regulator [Xylanimonas protaetiae]
MIPVAAASERPGRREPGLRERKKVARRGAIVDAAQQLVLAQGLDDVTVEMISARVGISARTFFNYFDSKDDAVLGLEDVTIDVDAAARFAAGGPTGHLMADLQTVVASVLQSVSPDEGRARCAHEIARSHPRLLHRQVLWMERYKADLTALFAARRAVDPDAVPVDDETLAMIVVVLLRSAAVAWERDGYAGDAAAHLPAAVAELRALLAT